MTTAGLSSQDFALYRISASFSASVAGGLIVHSRRISDSAVHLWSASPSFSRLLLKRLSDRLHSDLLEKKVREQLVSAFLKNFPQTPSASGGGGGGMMSMMRIAAAPSSSSSSLVQSVLQSAGVAFSSSSSSPSTLLRGGGSRNGAGQQQHADSMTTTTTTELLPDANTTSPATCCSTSSDYNPISILDCDPLLLSLFLTVHAYNLFSALHPSALLFHVLTSQDSDDRVTAAAVAAAVVASTCSTTMIGSDHVPISSSHDHDHDQQDQQMDKRKKCTDAGSD